MAIVTIAEVQAVLGMNTAEDDIVAGTTERDAQIAFFIPIVQEDIIEYVGHAFQDGYVTQDGALTIASSTGRGDSITDPNAKFIVAGFAPGMDVALEGGFANVGVWTIGSSSGAVTAGTIFLGTSDEFIAQDRTDEINPTGNIKVSRVKWPKSIKVAAAQMVWHLIDNPMPNGAVSESLGDYSVSYAGANQYPETVLKGLNKWRKVNMI